MKIGQTPREQQARSVNFQAVAKSQANKTKKKAELKKTQKQN